MSIKQNGGVFGRNPTFNDVTIEGDLIINGEVFTGLDFQGSWNASTNSPALASSVGTNGEFYIVSVAGTTNLNGITNWGIGDWAIFNGTAWQRVEGGADGNFNALTANSLNVNGTATMDDLTVNNNVGIGTSSPTQKLSLYAFRGYNADSALFSDVAINDDAVDNNAVHAWRTGMTGDAAGHDLTFSTLARTESTYQERLRILANGDISFYEDTGTTAKFFWDASAESLGIGTSSPSHAIDVSTSATTWAGAIKNTDATNGLGLFVQSAESASKAILGAYSGSSYKFYVRGDGNVGIGTTAPSASALLDVQSTTKGVRFPNMTTTQKNAMADVAGMQVYDTTLNKMCFNTGSAWETITSS